MPSRYDLGHRNFYFFVESDWSCKSLSGKSKYFSPVKQRKNIGESSSMVENLIKDYNESLASFSIILGKVASLCTSLFHCHCNSDSPFCIGSPPKRYLQLVKSPSLSLQLAYKKTTGHSHGGFSFSRIRYRIRPFPLV